MGRAIDLDSPLSEEDKAYLRERGRGYLIDGNERRFGKDGTRTPEPWETAGASAQSPFYDNQERDRAVYDKGGAPLPGVVLDYDTGRAYDREDGVTVEYSGPGRTPGGYALPDPDPEDGVYDPLSGFTERALDDNGNPVDDDFDDDIVGYVKSIPNVGEIREELSEHEIPWDKDDKRPELNDKLIVFYQDLRNQGVEITFEESDEDEDNSEEENSEEGTGGDFEESEDPAETKEDTEK